MKFPIHFIPAVKHMFWLIPTEYFSMLIWAKLYNRNIPNLYLLALLYIYFQLCLTVHHMKQQCSKDLQSFDIQD